MEMKKLVGRDVLIYYPNSIERFIIHTDARKMQLGRVSSDKWESYCLLLTQVTPLLINDTTTEIKLSGIVETLNDKSVPFY